MPGSASRMAGHSMKRQNAARTEAKLCRKPEAFRGYAVEADQQHARRQRHVEEDMRDEDAGEAIDVEFKRW